MFGLKTKTKSKSKSLARKLITIESPKAIVSEQFKTIRSNINFSMPDQELKTLVVTSATAGEGKSTSSSNIAAVFAQSGKKVLLIDGDMRKPTVQHTFSLTNTTGLSTVLTRQTSISETIQTSVLLGLDILTSGPIPPNPAELISSKGMQQLIEQLKEQYDLLIFDAPPILAVTDAQLFSNICEGTILVVNSGKAEKEATIKAKDKLVDSQANILGVVLNNFEIDKDHYYYKYYGEEE